MENKSTKLSDLKAGRKPLAANASASVWDVGDGVACLEFHSKMNTIDLDTMAMGIEAVAIASKTMRALLIHNEATHFSVGANLGMFLNAATAEDWNSIDSMITRGQAMMRAIKFSPVPVVAAPSGLALGGGCEVLLHCASVQAHAGLSTGLVEPLVGLIPGWGGSKEVLIRKGATSPESALSAVLVGFEQISLSRASKSASEARELNYLRPADGITMDVAQLFADAKSRALSLAENYMPKRPVRIHVPGQSAYGKLMENAEAFGKSLPHDQAISHHLATVMCGGENTQATSLSEDDVFDLEKHNFIALCKMPNAVARIDAMLKTGKPLRN
jgi:3-hydroxyacyl-CoA dehydrogenase